MRTTVRHESRTAPRSDCDRATERVRADRVPQIQAQQQHPPRALLARCVAARGGGGDLSLFAFVPSRSRIRSRDRPRAAHHASSDRLGPRAQYVLWQHAMLAGVVLLVRLDVHLLARENNALAKFQSNNHSKSLADYVQFPCMKNRLPS